MLDQYIHAVVTLGVVLVGMALLMAAARCR